MSKIVYIETSPAERDAAKAALIRALNGMPRRRNLVVKEQATNNSLSQANEVVTR